MPRLPPNSAAFKAILFKGIVVSAPVDAGDQYKPQYFVLCHILNKRTNAQNCLDIEAYLYTDYDAYPVTFQIERLLGKDVIIARFNLGKGSTWQGQD